MWSSNFNPGKTEEMENMLLIMLNDYEGLVLRKYTRAYLRNW